MVLNDYRLKPVRSEDDKVSIITDGFEKQEELIEQLPFPDVAPSPFLSIVQTAEETTTPVGSKNEKAAPITVAEPTSQPWQSREIDATPATRHVQRSNPARTVVIPATGKKSAGTMRAPKGRSRVIHLGVCVALVAILFSVLMAVLPADTQGHSSGGLFQPLMRMIASRKNDTALIAAQAATATAVTQDGYEYNGAGGSHPFAGVNTNITPVSIPAPAAAPASSTVFNGNFANPFSPGQCTWWADYRYHELTGFAIPWTGNASAWAYNAPGFSGWAVSDSPRVPSIIVLQPGVQYASGWGHVAIVERINSDGSVYTSNYNVLGWGVLSYSTYRPMPGVSFVYHT